MSFRGRLFACAAIALLMQGCAVLPGGGPAPLDTFDLSAPSNPPTGPRRPGVQVLVAEPTALKTLDGQSIVIKTSATTIEYLQGAQWADRLPRVVQARMVETLQASDSLGGVGKPGEGLAIDYQIATELRTFGIRVDGQPRAEIELFVKIINDRNGVVRRSQVFRSTVPAGGSGNDAFVAALDRAFDDVASQVTAWTLSSI